MDKYVYVIIKERFDDLIYINWTKKEIVDSVDKIEHELVREALEKTGIERGVEITTLADIPSEGSGLGSSSSLTVGLLNAFYTFQGIQTPSDVLAREACEIEIDIIGKPIGKQDQYAAAFGGLNEIIFHKEGKVRVNKVNLTNDKIRILGSNLLLFYTNITRLADGILKKQKDETETLYGTLLKMRNQVSFVKRSLENGDNDSLGFMLKEGWDLKRSLVSTISNPQIDDMYERALKSGAVGGKICGAGGFLLLYVLREKQNAVRSTLKGYRELPFMLERFGSRIIFNQRSDYWK